MDMDVAPPPQAAKNDQTKHLRALKQSFELGGSSVSSFAERSSSLCCHRPQILCVQSDTGSAIAARVSPMSYPIYCIYQSTRKLGPQEGCRQRRLQVVDRRARKFVAAHKRLYASTSREMGASGSMTSAVQKRTVGVHARILPEARCLERFKDKELQNYFFYFH